MKKEIAYSASSGSDGYFAHRAIGPPCILEEQAFPLRLSRTHRLRTLVAEAAHPLLHLKQSAFSVFCICLFLAVSSGSALKITKTFRGHLQRTILDETFD